MLSDDLRSLENLVEQIRDGAVVLGTDGVSLFLSHLKDCRRQAQAMERGSLIAQELSADNLTKDVIVFPISARPYRRLIRYPDPDQGGAA